MLSIGSRVSANTMRFLLSVSSHLSWKPECKDVIYSMTIHDDGSVLLAPGQVRLFRDTHHRREADRVGILEHVLLDHVSDLRSADAEIIRLDPSKVVPGKYLYFPSFGGHRRRWMRVPSFR